MGIYDVDDYLARAKTFIAAADENSLRHACLELRLALERIVYQKLGQIGPKLPLAIFRKWQPDKALKMLRSFEPKADLDMSIEVTGPDGVPFHIGDYKMFSVDWLNKRYNKLGNFLHAPALADTRNLKLTPTAVQEILDEIARVASATMMMSINAIDTFPCDTCGKDMYASEAQIKANATVECPRCESKHLVRWEDEENYIVEPSNLCIAPCMKCKSPMAIEHLEVNDRKACWNCGQLHHFDWGYTMVPSGSEAASKIEA
jgi:DNA-directed RNA polymerase subunit RPC12/RpoP